MIRIDLEGHNLVLLAEKALLWTERQMLVLTDPHFGKGATFRSRGLPIPSGSTRADLGRLAALIGEYRPREVMILGDFFHTRESQSDETLEALAEWRAGCRELAVTLIPGNHDRHAGAPPEELGIELRPEPAADGPFLFCHHPREHPAGYVLAGHVHPGVTLRSPRGGPSLTAPCFHFAPRVGLLPAFGSFTGTSEVAVGPSDRLFLVGPGQVIEIPARLACLPRR